MRIIFIGSTEFGFECLRKLIEIGQKVVAIFVSPKIIKISWSEKPLEIIGYKNFQDIASKNNIPLIEINKSVKDYVDLIKSFKPNFIFAAGWYSVIPEVVREIPSFGCAGIHNALLPKYRGGAPLVWAIINGEKKSGVSFLYLNEKIDSGDIITQREILITKKDDIKTVYEKATKVALKILKKYIPLIEEGRAPRIKQDENKAIYVPPRKPEDGLIDWKKTSWEIYNWIRAQTKPYPGAFFLGQEGQKIKVWSVKSPSKTKKILQEPGTILSQNKKEMKIATGNGYIIITNWEISE